MMQNRQHVHGRSRPRDLARGCVERASGTIEWERVRHGAIGDGVHLFSRAPIDIATMHPGAHNAYTCCRGAHRGIYREAPLLYCPLDSWRISQREMHLARARQRELGENAETIIELEIYNLYARSQPRAE